jgi:hypothetical protein
MVSRLAMALDGTVQRCFMLDAPAIKLPQA